MWIYKEWISKINIEREVKKGDVFLDGRASVCSVLTVFKMCCC